MTLPPLLHLAVQDSAKTGLISTDSVHKHIATLRVRPRTTPILFIETTFSLIPYRVGFERSANEARGNSSLLI